MKVKIELDDAIKICKQEKRKNAILSEGLSLIIKWLNELKYKRKELKIYKKAYKMLAEDFWFNDNKEVMKYYLDKAKSEE